MPACRAAIALLLAGLAGACRSKPPAVAVAPAPLNAQAAAALRWVDAHAYSLSSLDSTHPRTDRAPFLSFVGAARVLGVSELAEGTHEFPLIVQRMLATLAEDASFRGLAVQASMPEAMDLDRYVRSGDGDPRRALRALGPHWDVQEVLTLVEWMRQYNRNRAAAEQVGFYGFEIPNAARALQVVTSLPDSVAGAALGGWLKRELQCVSLGESAAWGRGSVASDSVFWTRCRGVTSAAADSLAVLRARTRSARAAADVAFAENMARLLHHYVETGLRQLPRHETVAEHILWIANGLGSEGKLLVWGRDVESGRLTLAGNVVQSAVALSRTLGDRYRNLAFTFGEGTIRARPITPGREPGGERNMTARIPTAGSIENVLNRAALDVFLLDLRGVRADSAASWLEGPRAVRLISGVYTPDAPGAFETPLEFPANYDGVLFARRVTPATPLKH